MKYIILVNFWLLSHIVFFFTCVDEYSHHFRGNKENMSHAYFVIRNLFWVLKVNEGAGKWMFACGFLLKAHSTLFPLLLSGLGKQRSIDLLTRIFCPLPSACIVVVRLEQAWVMVFAQNLTHVHSSHKYPGCAQWQWRWWEPEPQHQPQHLYGLNCFLGEERGKSTDEQALADKNVSLWRTCGSIC